MEQEIWKDVVEWEDMFDVSNLGNIRSKERDIVAKDGRKMHIKGQIRTPCIDCHGYFYIKATRNGKQYFIRFHRAVAEAFIPNPDNKPYIDHIDTNPKNNTVSLNRDGSVDISKTNLRWVTCKENSNNPLTVKHIKDACTEENIKKQIQSKKNNGTWQGRCVYQYDMNGVFVTKYETISDAANATRTHIENISNAIDVESKSAGGFLWRSMLEDNVKYTQNLLRGKTPIAMIDEENGKEIKRWDTLKSLTNELKLNRHGLSYSLRYKDGRYKGAFFKYIQKE